MSLKLSYFIYFRTLEFGSKDHDAQYATTIYSNKMFRKMPVFSLLLQNGVCVVFETADQDWKRADYKKLLYQTSDLAFLIDLWYY